jgi:DNA polymerase III, alpha subunit
MNENHKKFVDGAVNNGHDKNVAEKVYQYIETFGNYGFNKSHSVAYSMIAFWLAYIKVHFPGAFYTCLLNANLNNETKVAFYIQDAKDHGVKIKNVNINKSNYDFEYKDSAIRFGLLSIKGLRRDFSKDILSARKKDGNFKNEHNFLQRIDDRFVKNDFIEPLILSGAFDEFNRNRKELLLDIRDLIESVQLAGKNLSLFDVLDPKNMKLMTLL